MVRHGRPPPRAEMRSVLGDEAMILLEEIGVGHDDALAEIRPALVDAVALRRQRFSLTSIRA